MAGDPGRSRGWWRPGGVRPAAGRVPAASPGHLFSELSLAIDQAFARWNLTHDHLFELADGRRMGFPDELDPERLDDEEIAVCEAVGPGDTFGYTFDLRIGWRHRCTVLAERLDPLDVFGDEPPSPMPVDGWGWIPDQYGRTTPKDGVTPTGRRG